MKKITVTLMVTLLCMTFFVCFAEQKTFDFRNIYWGMSINDVLKSEKQAPTDRDENALLYNIKISSYDCNLIYSFIDNRLYEATYFFNKSHVNYFNYINDFYSIKEMLDKKYGPYTDDVEMWRNDPGYSMDKGTAVAMGYLSYISRWSTETTDINLLLHSYESQPCLILQYASKQLKSLADEKREKEDLSNL